MQDAVERILAGEFNNDIHSLDFSSPRIELSLSEGEIYEGSFFIYGPANALTEGTVTSSRLRMECITDRFYGAREEIYFRFHTADMVEGDHLKGEFRIISNHGEYSIPYEVSIEASNVESSLGNIRNLFHFANLAKTNWEEAVNLFYSKNFRRIFHGVDRQFYAVYRGLAGGAQKEQNVEEFLLEIKKKQKVEFLVEEDEIRIDNPEKSMEYKIVINRNGWGFSELTIAWEGDFLILEKPVIREEDFLGNCYRLPYYIAEEKLHNGKNFGTITLQNAYTSLSVTIFVYQRPVVMKVPGIRIQKKRITVELMQYYEAFRTKKVSAAFWLKETKKLVEQLVEADEKDVAARLFRVQLLITEERFNEASWLLNQIEDVTGEQFDPVLYCYYLYLTTLINREETYIDEVSGTVERIFTQYSDNWRIAWLLLYLSEDYGRSPSRKWLILEDQFKHRCKSPVLYIEAWNLITVNPTLLMRLEDFELQVLTYAAKKGLLEDGVIEQITYLALKQKRYSERLFYILEACYRKSPGDEVLQAICTLLIKGNMTEKEHFIWYAKGIEKELRITRLYEYYMMSCELTEQTQIPKIVLMYFAFDSSLDSIHNAFLYSYVHKNREQYPELYENYREQIERFLVFQILKGRNNKWLSYLYRNIINPVMITEETAKGLSTVLFVNRVYIRREHICKVIVVYEKKQQEKIWEITGKEAYIPIYGSDYKILLEDGSKNRYCREEDFLLERLLIPDKIASMITPYLSENIDYDIWLCERGKEIADVNNNNVENMKRAAAAEVLSTSFQKEIRMKLIHFFYNNDRMKELDDFLALLSPEQIENECYAEVVRFMVIRGMYEKAYEWIKIKGGFGIDAKTIMRLCSRLLAFQEMEENETMTALVYLAFKAGKYDENLLVYLTKYYTGTVREMRDIWKAARSFSVDAYEISERILKQMLYTGAFVGESIELFKCYISGGAKTEVELAFLAQSSFDYFVKEKITDVFIMQDIQRAMERQENLPGVCKLAYTRFYAENKRLIDDAVSRYLVIFLRELLAKNIYFPYFKDYADYIPFMRQFADKTMIQYKLNPGNKAVIHYLIEKEDSNEGEYIKEEMQNMFGGICVKQFILFFGERLQYYITETEGDKEQLTESGTFNRNDTDRELRESKYSLINDIAIGRTLHDYETMEHLLYEYFEQEYIVQKTFHLL